VGARARQGNPQPCATAAQGKTRIEKRTHEIERLTCEVEAWRKKAEVNGSLFDLKKDNCQGYRHDDRRQYLIASLDGAAKGAQRRDQGNQGYCPQIDGGALRVHANSECGGSYVVASAQPRPTQNN
jgi:hypothetical protein